MKKTLSIVALALVVIMMMGCLAACGGGGKVAAGTYQLKEASGSGAESYESMKDSITLEVNDDGTASMNVAGISAAELTFNESSGKVSFQGAEVPYSVSGNKVTIEDASGKLIFEK